MTDKRNLSTEHQREGDALKPSDTLDRAQTPEVGDPEGRGVRAHIDADSGAARGSGSGAGGGNPGEDYDEDPVSGGGDLPETRSRRAADAGAGH